MNNHKIAAVVVFYNPNSDVIRNISTYLDQVDFIFIIDNSEEVNQNLIIELKKNNNVEITLNHENLGIAAALNLGAIKAINYGYSYLLTMDQDSKAEKNMVNNLFALYNKTKNAGIISPLHSNINYKLNTNLPYIQEMNVVMTSGNILDLKAYKKAGGFDESLFIDYVDIDLCFKLIINDYKIFRANTVYLNHNEGNLQTKKILNLSFRTYNHSPIRWYYKIRNFNYIKKKYYKIFTQYFKEEKKRIKKDVLKILLIENQKFEKIKFIIQGYIDYKKGVVGRYPCKNMRRRCCSQ